MPEAWKSISINRKALVASTEKALLIRLPDERGQLWISGKLLRETRKSYLIRCTPTMTFIAKNEDGKPLHTYTGNELAEIMGGWSDEFGTRAELVAWRFAKDVEEVIHHKPDPLPVPENVAADPELMR